MVYYEIVVQNHIDHKWLRDFAKLDYKLVPDRKTLIFGNLKDQVELFSILSRSET